MQWSELAEAVPELKLPKGIYKCSYCPKYVPSDDPANPTSLITKHIMYNCQKVPRGNGPVRIQFSTIDNVDEIRKNYANDLPYVHRCCYCKKIIRSAGSNELMTHLLNEHSNELFELR